MELPDQRSQEARARVRARQRMRVRLAYHREKARLEAKKLEISVLENHVATLESSRGLNTAVTHKRSCSRTLIVLYESVMKEVKTLLRNKKELESIIKAHLKFRYRLHYLMMGSPESPQKPSELECVTDSYQRIIHTTIAEVLWSSSLIKTEPTPGSVETILGWTKQNEHDGPFLRFSLHKNFQNVLAKQLCRKTWEIVSSPTEYARLYSPHVGAQVHLVNQLDDDTLLLYTELSTTYDCVRTRSLYLVHRANYSNRHIILMRSVDPATVPSAATVFFDLERDTGLKSDEPRWVDMFAWTIFDDLGTDSCSFKLCGRSQRSWDIEVLLLAMRWQHTVFGYERVLPSEVEKVEKKEPM